jgi:hypothetical protein
VDPAEPKILAYGTPLKGRPLSIRRALRWSIDRYVTHAIALVILGFIVLHAHYDKQADFYSNTYPTRPRHYVPTKSLPRRLHFTIFDHLSNRPTTTTADP